MSVNRYYISVVIVFKTSSGNKAEILSITGKTFDECVKKMHSIIDNYRNKGNPVIQHTIVDIWTD